MDKPNRRETYRLRLYGVTCRIATVTVAGKAMPLDLADGELDDVSSTGCSIKTELDLPIRLPLKCVLDFTLRGELFQFTAVPMRKIDDRRIFRYAMHFDRAAPHDQSRLVRAMMAIEVDRRQDPEG